jgi:hypothetical protein
MCDLMDIIVFSSAKQSLAKGFNLVEILTGSMCWVMERTFCYDLSYGSRARSMTIEQLQALARYVTDDQGKAEVRLPVDVWESLLRDLQSLVDQQVLASEMDSKDNILEDLKESMRLSQAGKTFPVSELWDGIGV